MRRHSRLHAQERPPLVGWPGPAPRTTTRSGPSREGLRLPVVQPAAGGTAGILLQLQALAGNGAVVDLMAGPGLAVQRCGPVPCDCRGRGDPGDQVADPVSASVMMMVQRQVGPCPDVVTPHRVIKRHSVHPAVREAQRKLNQHSQVLSATGEPPLDKTPLDPDCKFGKNTRDAVVDFQKRVFPDRKEEWDGIVGDKTWAELDRVAGTTPPINPPAKPAPDASSEADKMSRARDDSRSLMDTAIIKLGAMDDAFRLGLMDAVPELRQLHAPTITAVETWLRVKQSDLVTFLHTTEAALDMMRKARAVDGPPRHSANGVNQCGPDAFATAVIGDTSGPVNCCDSWFPKGPQCRRNTMTHERFHLVGAHHGESAEGFQFPVSGMTPDEALDDADNLTDLAKQVAGEPIIVCSGDA